MQSLCFDGSIFIFILTFKTEIIFGTGEGLDLNLLAGDPWVGLQQHVHEIGHLAVSHLG